MIISNNPSLRAPLQMEGQSALFYVRLSALLPEDASFEKNTQTTLSLFCLPFLQNSLILIYVFQSLVNISAMEDGASIALPDTLLFSLGKSLDFILGNTLQKKKSLDGVSI